MEKTRKINTELERVLNAIFEKEKEIDDLSQNKMVKKYLKSLSEKDALETIKKELQVQQMENCNHYFVIHAIDDGWDGHRCNYSNIATCIHCGLTNRFGECSLMWEEFPYNKMKQLIYNGAMCDENKYHGYYERSDINELKKLYKSYEDANPDMTDAQIEEAIAKVKKPISRADLVCKG